MDSVAVDGVVKEIANNSDALAKLRGLPGTSKALALAAIIGGAYAISKARTKPKRKEECRENHEGKKKEVPFWDRLLGILRIMFSGKDRTRIILNLTGLTTTLVLRTLLSIQVAITTGQVAQHLVQRNWEMFLHSVIRFSLIGIPAAFVNSGLKYFTNMMSLLLRRNLTDHINSHYIVGVNFYKANQLPTTRIENVDQRVTADVETFCEQLSNLYSSIFKPILDIVLNTWKLSGMMGIKAPLVLFGYYMTLAQLKMWILRFMDIKRHTQKQSELQGDYRTAHSRLITYAEEIAFFEGAAREQGIITQAFRRLFGHTAKLHKLHGINGILDQYLAKYGASITGYGLLCIPVFFSAGSANASVSDLTRDYVLNRQLLMDLASGIGVLLGTTTKVSSFMGITTRVAEVLERVVDLNQDVSANFVLRADEEKEQEIKEGPRVATVTEAWLDEWHEKGEELRRNGKRRHVAKMRSIASSGSLALAHPLSRDASYAALAKSSPALVNQQRTTELGEDAPLGTVQEGDTIQFIHTSIVSPDGRLLIRDLNLDVPQGRNVMITGPNGCGKSSLFRVLGELWPPYRGVVVKPHKEDIVFVPQKPYLVMGTLRDQIIYPHSAQEMHQLGVTDDDLTTLLDIVDPARSIVSSWKYDDVKNWSIALSGGQKQRVAMARVFYHRPRYAILDECTSAVSSEVEGKIYTTCRKLHITLFTVSHRPQLQQYHEYQLRLDGHGNWKFLTRDEADRTPVK